MIANGSTQQGWVSVRRLAAVTLMSVSCTAVFAQTGDGVVLSNQTVADQVSQILQAKDARSGAQRKLGSHLWYAVQAARGQAQPGLDEVYGAASQAIQKDSSGKAKVKISGNPSEALQQQIAAAGGTVKYVSQRNHAIVALVPLQAVEGLAASADVQRIVPAARARTNVGALTSQGYISHKANLVVNSGINGSGVRVGVLSDSVEALNDLIATGDLANVTVLPGAAGSGESEGTAMMEIVHDLAPGAQLFFATAFDSEEGFADNIRTLRFTYHCDIIVDDVSYFDEPAFQDGMVAQAVNDVTADGALYFSAAANSGNLTSGTSGTWEGDFKAGAPSSVINGYTAHVFSGTQQYDVLTTATTWIGLHWSDAWGTAANDYDLILLNSTGRSVLCASVDTQNGTDSYPIEGCYNANGWPAGTRIVVATKNGSGAAPRALHIDTERGTLTIATSGATFGHNAGRNTVSTAAVYWNSAKTGTRAFVGGAANPTETFSSDGPRKVFFTPDGTALTPGNFLFATNGGETLVKPEIAAADGASAKTPGFNPFFGTSAAAPHAAAIAALIKSARPDYTNAQILTAMKQTALDIRAAGIDRDAGYGLVMALEAVNYAKTH